VFVLIKLERSIEMESAQHVMYGLSLLKWYRLSSPGNLQGNSQNLS
jgi:hypothetical protein